jgi:hypothetical protein
MISCVFSFMGYYLNINQPVRNNSMFTASFAMTIITASFYLLYYLHLLITRRR